MCARRADRIGRAFTALSRLVREDQIACRIAPGVDLRLRGERRRDDRAAVAATKRTRRELIKMWEVSSLPCTDEPLQGKPSAHNFQ